MHLYRATFSDTAADGVLSHFGTLEAAVNRTETIFAVESRWLSNGLTYSEYDKVTGDLIRTQTAGEHLETFATFVEKMHLRSYAVDIKKPLHINDCWDDDPIGSGAMALFEKTDITVKERNQLRDLFAPFEGIIWPQHVYAAYTEAQLRKIRQEGMGNGIFRREFEKRKNRCARIGEDFNRAADYEAVWLTKTLRLRNWAMQNGYDAFSYDNIGEGGADEIGYITLRSEQISKPLQTYRFEKSKYLNDLTDVFARALYEGSRVAPGEVKIVKKLFNPYFKYCDPKAYWRCVP